MASISPCYDLSYTVYTYIFDTTVYGLHKKEIRRNWTKSVNISQNPGKNYIQIIVAASNSHCSSAFEFCTLTTFTYLHPPPDYAHWKSSETKNRAESDRRQTPHSKCIHLRKVMNSQLITHCIVPIVWLWHTPARTRNPAKQQKSSEIQRNVPPPTTPRGCLTPVHPKSTRWYPSTIGRTCPAFKPSICTPPGSNSWTFDLPPSSPWVPSRAPGV